MTILKEYSYKYTPPEGSNEPTIEFNNLKFGMLNLIVGKNGSGKTELLESIHRLILCARGLFDSRNKRGCGSSEWNITLEHEGKEYKCTHYIDQIKTTAPSVEHELLKKWADHSLTLWQYNRFGGGDSSYANINDIIDFVCEYKNQCCLIDNFAEGLDWEQAAKATNKIRRACETHKIQFIVATVDKHVMNHIPLKHWTLLDRKKDKFKMYNIHNSKKQFDEFDFTGLSNCDLLMRDYLSLEWENEN